MSTGAIIALVVGGVAVAGGAFWWIHSTSKATTPAATKPAASSGGWLSTVTGVSGAANQLSGAFVNVTSGLSNLQDL